LKSIRQFQSQVHPIAEIDLERYAAGEIHRCALAIVHDGAGDAVRIPVLIARGTNPGPVLGITAAVHGNEVNGIPVIQKLFADLDPDELSGTVIGCPIVNMPAYLANDREMDGFDINRLMPGRPDGNAGEVYAHRFVERVLKHFDYLLDLHTASFGRANSLYVRADLADATTRRMARLQQPEIIVHNEARDGTLRGAADDLEIPAITVELGNPQRFQYDMIADSLVGVKNVMSHFEMIEHEITEIGAEPIECRRSYWMYAEHGGLLEVEAKLLERVKKGQRVARVKNAFGDILAQYDAPEDCIVVGRATNPVCQTGARVVHLGVTAKPKPKTIKRT
jgi:predicted deacylase